MDKNLEIQYYMFFDLFLNSEVFFKNESTNKIK